MYMQGVSNASWTIPRTTMYNEKLSLSNDRNNFLNMCAYMMEINFANCITDNSEGIADRLRESMCNYRNYSNNFLEMWID